MRGARLTGSEPGLVGYWPLDEGGGAILHDRSANRLDGTVTAPGWYSAGSTLPAPPLIASATTGPALRLAGHSTLSMFGHPIVDGRTEIQPDRATFDGRLDLFGQNPLLRVTGHVNGAIGADRLQLHGDADVALGGLDLAAVSADLDEERLTMRGRWLDYFDTELRVDGASGRLIVTGTITGGFAADVTFPSLYVPTPTQPVKKADSFHLPLSFEVNLNVRAEEATGLWLDGDAGFVVAGQRRRVHLHLSVVPSTFDQLANRIADSVHGMAGELFDALYPTAQAWLDGVTSGAIGWTRTAWDDTAKVFKLGFGVAAADVAPACSIGRAGRAPRSAGCCARSS